LIYRFENVPTAYVAYLAKLFWPVNLAVIYPIPQRFYPLKVAMVVAALICISAATWLARQRAPYLLIGWFWFLGTLVPVIGFIQVGGQAMADRYSYIPSIGVFIMIVFGVSDLAARFHFPKTALVAVAAFVLTACVGLTEKQLSYWAGSETLFRHALAVTEDNDIAHINLGAILEVDGKPDEAIAEGLAAEQIAPGNFEIHNNLGDCFNQLGQPEKALPEYREAVRLNPNLAYIHHSLGTVLVELGRYDDALVEFTNDMRLDPASPWSHFEMAKAMLKLGQDSAAIEELHQVLQLTPDDIQTLTFTAHVLAAIDNPQVRDGKTALTLAAQASTLTGGEQVLVLAAVGMADADTGDFTNAVAITKKALDLTTAADGEQLPDDQKKLQQQTKRRLEEQLQLYQNHQPWRESFRDTNAPVKP
jgi:tetratricopeptide (TPR) repeat protein